MRVGDLQQIMLQTSTVGKVQQQGSHGAEVEQSKLVAQHLIKDKEKEERVQTAEDTVFIKDREARRQQEQSFSDRENSEDESGTDAQKENLTSDLSQTGSHIDIKV